MMKKKNFPQQKVWTFKELMGQSFTAGIWVGAIFAGATLLENLSPNGNNTIGDVIRYGVFGFLFPPFLILLGFGVTKYIVPWMTNRRLRSARYTFLHDNGFTINKDFLFEGIYKGYHIRIIPVEDEPHKRKFISYDIIESYYEFPDQAIDEEKLSGNYYFGQLIFHNHVVGFITRNHTQPDFEEALNGLVTVLTREKLQPLSLSEWKMFYGTVSNEDSAG